MLWSLLHSLLQASTAFCSWCCRPRGHDVRSSPSPISFALWACHTFSWSPSVCAPVSKSGGLAGLLQSPGSVHSSDGSSASRPFLRFLLRDTVYQFQALCFGLSTAPPVFTWVMAPVSALLHSLGIRMRRYLDTWLVQSSSQESLLEVLLPVLRLCPVFGIVIHPRYSNLVPSQVVRCLWVVFDSTSFRASPSVERISRRQSATAVFMSCASTTASLWLLLLGVLSSLAHLVPGG